MSKKLLCLWVALSATCTAGVISDSPDFLPNSDIGSAPGAVYTVSSSGFANGWTIQNIRIFNIHVPAFSGCAPLAPVCTETDDFTGRFTVSALINGNEFLESGPMQAITVLHNRTFSGTDLVQDVMTISIGWMRAYPPGGAVPLMIWLNPTGSLVATNIGGGLYDMTLNWTAHTALRTEIPVFTEVAGPDIPLTFVPEPVTVLLMAAVLFVCKKERPSAGGAA